MSKTVTAEGETFGSAGGFNVIVAVEEPIALDAVTVSVPDAGIVAGAVYKPEEVTAPTPAVQVVAPGALNCWVPERATDTDEGETTGAEPIGTVMVFPKADKEFLAENVVLVALAGWYTDDVIVVGVTVPVDNCTPPSDTRPNRCNCRPPSSARCIAFRIAGFFWNSPEAICMSMRVMSICTTRPAPRFI